MKNAQNTASALVSTWERRAKGELYLDALLHPVAKQWLVSAVATVLEGVRDENKASGLEQEPIKTPRRKREVAANEQL